MRNKILFTSIFLSFLFLFSNCKDELPVIESLEIESIGNDTLYTGKQYPLTVLISPTSVSSPRLSWSISDGHLAEIQYGGILRPLKEGEVTVFVTSLQSDGRKVRTSKKFILMNSGVYLNNRAVTIAPQRPKKLGYKFLPEDYNPNEKISWSSDDSNIVSVDDDGNLTGRQIGETIVRIKLGNPFSDFYSEDSCLVTVENFKDPVYSLNGNVLTFEQEVPGLLPMVAQEMPFLEKIILKGPINGTDFLFFLNNKRSLTSLDLRDTHVVSGGLKFVFKPSPYMEEEVYEIKENEVPERFFQEMHIENIVLPRGITSKFNFSDDFETDRIEFPDSYEQIEITQCNIKDLVLPKNLKSLKINVAILDKKDVAYFEQRNAFIRGKLNLPESLEFFECNVDFKDDLVIPSHVKHVRIGQKFKQLIFAPNSDIVIGPGFVAFYKQQYKRYIIDIDRLVLPEGLEEIGRETFAMGLPYKSISKDGHKIKEIVFPSSLKKIGSMAFLHCQFEEPIHLNEGLKEIGHSAFLYSSVKEVHIPSTIEKIGDQAFSLCINLEDVYILATEPPKVGPATFMRSRKMGKMHQLHVPKGSVKKYKEAGYGDFFYEIKEID